MENKLKSIIQKLLKEEVNKSMTLLENVRVSRELDYHLKNKISLTENVFRIYSDGYFNLINEVRNLYESGHISLCSEDRWIVESDLGKSVLLENGRQVWLDAPIEEEEDMIMEAEHRGKKVTLNSPFRTPGGPKKFAVYVKTPGGGVKKVTFGDPNLRVRNANKGAAKSFRARHKCSQKKDRTTAGYWSCNVSRYRKKLGLKSSRTW
jgi:exoribonuclease R